MTSTQQSCWDCNEMTDSELDSDQPVASAAYVIPWMLLTEIGGWIFGRVKRLLVR